METNGKKPLTTKSRGHFHMLRVAFYMLRRRSSRKPPMQMQVGQKSAWRRLMCIMRPLQSPPLAPALPIEEHAADDSFHDVTLLPQPSSPDYAPPRVFEDGMSSRYASAEDLNELDEEQNGGDAVVAVDDLSHEEEDGEESGNPHEIDKQAEEFIAKFYEQMRLQRIESMQRYNRWLKKQQAREEKEAELTPGAHVEDGLFMN